MWAIENISKDQEEKYNLIQSSLDHIKDYLNPEAFDKELEERNNKKQPTKPDPYTEMLLKRGAKPEEVLK